MTTSHDDAETLAAFADAQRRGIGWVQIKRIVTDSYRVSRIDPSLVVLLDDPVVSIERLHSQIMALPCSYCLAVANAPCRTVNGNRASYPHGDRAQPVYAAWQLGHRDGLVDALRRLLKDWDTPADELLKRHEVSW